MKPTRSIFPVALSLWCFQASPVFGQFYPPMTIGPSLLKFLPQDASFTANLVVSNRESAFCWPVRVAIRKGMTRVEMDISRMEQVRKLEGWADYVAKMQQAGSAESVSVFNPNKKCVYTILPHLKAYVAERIPDDALSQFEMRPKVLKVEMGTEEIGGRSATKAKLIYGKDGMDVWRTWETPEAIVWAATDASGIPLRIEVLNSVGDTNATLVFKDADRKQPASKLFAPPKGFTKCDQNSLMKRIMEKWPKDN